MAVRAELFAQETLNGEIIVDNFAGGGDMKAGRRGYTIELNNSYFRDAVGYLKAEEEKLETPTLFDLIGGA